MDIARVLCISLDLFAQLPDENPQGLTIVRMIRPPKKVQQFQVRHGLAPVHNEVLQEFKFRGRKVNRLSMSHNSAAFEVDTQSRGIERRHFLGAGHPSDDSANTRQKLL